MYKDAYGVRPRGVDTSGWSLEYFEQEFKHLAEIIEMEYKSRKEAEAAAIIKFEDRVTNLMHTGTNRERVIAEVEAAAMAAKPTLQLKGLLA